MSALAQAILAHGFGALVIVDDGGCQEYAPLFSSLAAQPAIHVLHHAVNLGKGRALKTAFNYILTELPSMHGIVTADADGQHTAADIAAVAEAMLVPSGITSATWVVLGTRSFGPDVPLRSRLGNRLTRIIFRFLTGVPVADTQTGLRGLPLAALPELLRLEGERYEYEMTMLAHLCRHGARPVEVPITTIYLDGNRGSHFDPIRDSMRIYFVLARFYFSSLIAAAIDFAGFSLAFAITGNLLASVAFGRLSSLVNFALNRKFVFNSRGRLPTSLLRYYILVAAIAGLSYLLIRASVSWLHWNVFAAKIVVDVLLSLVSFAAQRTYVFRRADAE
jgi:putative flippase GtrA